MTTTILSILLFLQYYLSILISSENLEQQSTLSREDEETCPVSSAFPKQIQKLNRLLNTALTATFKGIEHPDETYQDESSHSLGYGRLECIDQHESRLVQFEFGIKENQAVPMRSLSKIIASAAVMALQDRGVIDIHQPIGEAICPDSPLAELTPLSLLTMSAKPLDSRLNAMRAYQLKKQNRTVDFVGFPPLCDELGWNPSECVERLVCPVYRGEEAAFELAGVSKHEFESAPDRTCDPFALEKRKDCLEYANSNYCSRYPLFMRDHCHFACKPSNCQARLDPENTHKVANDTRWEYRLDDETGSIVKKENPFVYDNYAYTLVDAFVFKKTGKFLFEWARELVFEPLGMKGSIKCGREPDEPAKDGDEAEYECLAPPANLSAWYKREHNVWKGGQMSKTWVSNTFFASAKDMIKFLGALLRNGTTYLSNQGNNTKNRFLSQSAVDTIFGQHIVPQRPYGTCVGMQAFGMGIGYCFGKEVRYGFPFKYMSKTSKAHPEPLGTSMCTSERSYSWGGSHASRISLLRDKSVACVAILNTPNMGSYPTRAHYIGHNMSAILRDVFD